jgi:hypothetical protein
VRGRNRVLVSTITVIVDSCLDIETCVPWRIQHRRSGANKTLNTVIVDTVSSCLDIETCVLWRTQHRRSEANKTRNGKLQYILKFSVNRDSSGASTVRKVILDCTFKLGCGAGLPRADHHVTWWYDIMSSQVSRATIRLNGWENLQSRQCLSVGRDVPVV